MLIKFIFIFILLISGLPSYAQVASASLFSEMKSINPATIGNRKKGQITLISHLDNYEKVQDIDESQEAKLDSKVTGLSLFRGGSGGGFITTEISAIMQAGEREIRFRGGDPIDMDSTVDFNYVQVAMSFGEYLGVAITNQSFLLEQEFYLDMSGTIFESDEKITRDSLGVKFGAALPLGPLRLAVYYEMVNVEQKVESERPALPESETSPTNNFIGIGLGIVTDSFHFEVGIEQLMNPEKGLLESEDDPDPDARNCISATIEGKLFGITLGYTGRQLMDGYKNPEQTVVNQLIYGNSLEDRVEHIINFSLGGESGLSVGGSLTYSETTGEEISPIEPASLGNKYVTTSKQVGIMAKLGYVF